MLSVIGKECDCAEKINEKNVICYAHMATPWVEKNGILLFPCSTYVQENLQPMCRNRAQRANKLICNNDHTGEAALTGLPANWAKALAEGSWRAQHPPAGARHRKTQAAAPAVTPAHHGPNQRRLSLTQRRAVNQPAPRRELGGGPLAGPKQRHTYICKRFQRHYYFERMIEWS